MLSPVSRRHARVAPKRVARNGANHLRHLYPSAMAHSDIASGPDAPAPDPAAPAQDAADASPRCAERARGVDRYLSPAARLSMTMGAFPSRRARAMAQQQRPSPAASRQQQPPSACVRRRPRASPPPPLLASRDGVCAASGASVAGQERGTPAQPLPSPAAPRQQHPLLLRRRPRDAALPQTRHRAAGEGGRGMRPRRRRRGRGDEAAPQERGRG